jgi:hypothetical protein
MNRYEEQAEILAILTAKVDRYGRVGGMKKHKGRTVRILVLLEDPQSPRLVAERRRL